jgi:thioredoxin-related protein
MSNRIKIALIILLSVIILFGTSGILVAQSSRVEKVESPVDWVMSYKRGYDEAQEEGKPMFILITAPSWCSPCQRMEEEVFSAEEIADYLNDYFIPVMIPDVVNGERNPELDRFDFPGFPTMFILNSKGKEQDKIIGYVNPGYFYEFLNRYINPDIEKIEQKEDSDEPSYPESIDRALIDGQYAVRWLVSLYKSKEYAMCSEIADLIMDKANPEDIESYYEDMLYMRYISTIRLKEFKTAMGLSEEYLETYGKGKYIESVLYLRILMLFHLFDIEQAKKEAGYFLEVYPESIFIDRIKKLFR